MSDSLGPAGSVPVGTVRQSASGRRYEIGTDGGSGSLVATEADGGRRRQRVVGRIGAGLYDTSFVGAELDRAGRPTDRLSFLPVEVVRGHGLALSPFELQGEGLGLGQPVAGECLQCHTLDAAPRLPAGNGPDARHTLPRNLLGAEALRHLAPLDCAACHGATGRHADLMTERVHGDPDDLGLARLRDLPASGQRDICARCHLQGDAQIELAPVAAGGPQPADFLARRPTLVPARPGDDFRFVGQLERLALSACFRGSEAMTCTTCHAPHTAVARQGVATFDAACRRCHVAGGGAARECARPPDASVGDVTGEAARSAEGCVDCHVRRSQPFDLPLVRTADHFIRRRIPRPATAPFRAFADPAGPLAVFDDGRLAASLATEEGRHWQSGLLALGALRLGRNAEAAERLADVPASGTPAASTSAAREPPAALGTALPPLESCADFHHARGLLLEAVGDLQEARRAYGDALALDGLHPEARINRGALLLQAGDLDGALQDAATLIASYPRAEQPWNLRALAAARAGDVEAAASALAASVERWPSDAATWHELGRMLLRLGRRQDARAALAQAVALAPGRAGLAEDVLAAGDS